MRSMLQIRVMIGEALADSKGRKSHKGLAKALGISPPQVTSLLKPGGRELRIDEIPLAEKYLGIEIVPDIGNAIDLTDAQLALVVRAVIFFDEARVAIAARQLREKTLDRLHAKLVDELLERKRKNG